MLRQIRETTVVNQPERLSMVGGVGRRQAEPRLLDGVVRVLRVAEDPQGHGPEVRAVGFESIDQGRLVVHVSHSPGFRCHTA